MEQKPSVKPLLERDILDAKTRQEDQRLSIEYSLINARDKLKSQVGDNGDNMFNLLTRLVSRVLTENSGNAVDFFEEYCRLAKQDGFIHPDFKPKGSQHVQNVDFAIAMVKKLKSQTVLEPQSNLAQLAPLWAQINFALPPSVDYFIDQQMELLRRREDVRNVRFWGTFMTLSGSYYVIEEERDNFKALQLELQINQEKADMARGVIADLIRTTVSDDSIISDWCGAESMAKDMIEQILEGTIPPNTDKQLATTVAVPVMEQLIEDALDVAQEPEVELSVMGSLDVVSCSATLESKDLSLNCLKFASAIALLEVKMNIFRYYVCSDPFHGEWTELPGINMDDIVASRRVKRYFKGNLDASLGKSTERNHLRAVIGRISMDRFGAEVQNESNRQRQQLISANDLTVYDKATGFTREWHSANEESGHWLKSSAWPGSFVNKFTDHIYCGWGVEGLF